MRRREFIAGLGAAAWPLAARAQQDGRVPRVGILERGVGTDRDVHARWAAMVDGLAKLGWTEGRNVRFDCRFSADDPDRMHVQADELVRLTPDFIAVTSATATRALLQRTRTIPIVFSNVGDPVAGGLLKNIARPEGNATGITSLYQSIRQRRRSSNCGFLRRPHPARRQAGRSAGAVSDQVRACRQS